MIVISSLAIRRPSRLVAQELSEDRMCRRARRDRPPWNRPTSSTPSFPALPTAQGQLIRANADLQEVISTTVDEEALKIVPRRGDLEREAAQIYAKAFTEGRADRNCRLLQFSRRAEAD
jgi:hypothetical protein